MDHGSYSIGARGRQTNRFGGGVEIGARPALQVLGGGAGGIRGGENGVAEGATEFNGFRESCFGVVNEQRFKRFCAVFAAASSAEADSTEAPALVAAIKGKERGVHVQGSTLELVSACVLAKKTLRVYSDEVPSSYGSVLGLCLLFLFLNPSFSLPFAGFPSLSLRFLFRSHIHFNEFESKARAVSSPFNFIPLIRGISIPSLQVLFVKLYVAVKRSEVRTCNTPSHKFCGTCYSSRNCAHVYNTEGFPNGECRGFWRCCFCSRNCWN
ncbi:hypothetical protein VNO78_35511 [Psophocarpus tetragonolobus]|uniref:Knottins-like domain-containing protein n=1 Tax=Psophocarpus tetragonolobus TaxID=3891 RepID=A0AAN9RL57_PSOTE